MIVCTIADRGFLGKFVALAGKQHSRIRLFTPVFAARLRRLVVPRRGEEHGHHYKQ
jgi:hypothetical protein